MTLIYVVIALTFFGSFLGILSAGLAVWELLERRRRAPRPPPVTWTPDAFRFLEQLGDEELRVLDLTGRRGLRL